MIMKIIPFGSVANICVDDVDDELFQKYVCRGLDVTGKEGSPVHQCLLIRVGEIVNFMSAIPMVIHCVIFRLCEADHHCLPLPLFIIWLHKSIWQRPHGKISC